ncbi:hypothetical protein [Ruminococcus sp. FC2018]|uniref:hypothetical protein n=1 Tax=Ruminococcus sp. FC2018 TaxID=1410617 RepID=UPI000A72AD18|nr:hypothetical protein [Ruminococcus sp. FC2018]
MAFSKNHHRPSQAGRVNVFEIDYPLDRSKRLEITPEKAGGIPRITNIKTI